VCGEPPGDRGRAHEEKFVTNTRDLETAVDVAGRRQVGAHPRSADDAVIRESTMPRVIVNKALEPLDILRTRPGMPCYVENFGEDDRPADLDSLEEIRRLYFREEQASAQLLDDHVPHLARLRKGGDLGTQIPDEALKRGQRKASRRDYIRRRGEKPNSQALGLVHD
jgi:hypothetical protein